MAISGKSFAALCDHFPEYLPKVRSHASSSSEWQMAEFWCCLNGRHFTVVGAGSRPLALQVLLRATVFARMTPDQKTQLVKELQKLKWVQTETAWEERKARANTDTRAELFALSGPLGTKRRPCNKLQLVHSYVQQGGPAKMTRFARTCSDSAQTMTDSAMTVMSFACSLTSLLHLVTFQLPTATKATSDISSDFSWVGTFSWRKAAPTMTACLVPS